MVLEVFGGSAPAPPHSRRESRCVSVAVCGLPPPVGLSARSGRTGSLPLMSSPARYQMSGARRLLARPGSGRSPRHRHRRSLAALPPGRWLSHQQVRSGFQGWASGGLLRGQSICRCARRAPPNGTIPRLSPRSSCWLTRGFPPHGSKRSPGVMPGPYSREVRDPA
jgi:hypothetical protein